MVDVKSKIEAALKMKEGATVIPCREMPEEELDKGCEYKLVGAAIPYKLSRYDPSILFPVENKRGDTILVSHTNCEEFK